MAVAMVLALFNFFGQRPSETSATGQGASLRVSVPSRLRGGLIFQSRFTFSADHVLRHPALELSDNWFDGMTLNTTEPAAIAEGRGSDGLRFSYGKAAAGKSQTVYFEWSVNPTTAGSRDLTATLLDGDRVLTTVDRDLVVFP
jgi:hypothetical protein